MRIGIGLNLFLPDSGGVSNYAVTLLRHWHQYAPEHPMVLFTFDHNEPMLSQLPPEARRHERRIQVQEDVFKHLDEIDLYFCPFSSLWPRPMPLPTALTFHDMQERFYPQYFTQAQLEERFFHYDWSLRMADAVIAVSDFTRRSCIDLVGISPRKIRTVHHAPDALPAPRRPDGWEEANGWDRFVYYPANYWAHKNHTILLQALRQLREAGLPVRCVLTGSLFDQEQAWRQNVAAAGLEGAVRHLGRRPREEVSWLFHHARALVFPSLFEGFGIPLVEAMHSGCPIACSGVTGVPEVVQGNALYFNPTDAAEVARAIERVWTDDALCADLARRGRRRAEDFHARTLVAGHVAAFRSALRRYYPWKYWYRRRFLEARSRVPRKTLRPREARAAQRLLRQLVVNG